MKRKVFARSIPVDGESLNTSFRYDELDRIDDRSITMPRRHESFFYQQNFWYNLKTVRSPVFMFPLMCFGEVTSAAFHGILKNLSYTVIEEKCRCFLKEARKIIVPRRRFSFPSFLKSFSDFHSSRGIEAISYLERSYILCWSLFA